MTGKWIFEHDIDPAIYMFDGGDGGGERKGIGFNDFFPQRKWTDD